MVKILIEYPEIVDHTARMPFQCLGGAVHEVVGDHGGEKACAVLCKAGGSPASGREQGRNCAEQILVKFHPGECAGKEEYGQHQKRDGPCMPAFGQKSKREAETGTVSPAEVRERLTQAEDSAGIT